MTIPEFLEKLRETQGPWVSENGCIRCGDNCPITQVGGGENADQYHDIGDRLGMDWNDIEDVVFAADNDNDDVLADLRRQLLAATVNR